MSQAFKRILCPVDLSSFSLDALRLAVRLAESNDATLDVLHVIHNPFDEIYRTGMTQTDPALAEACANEPQRRGKILPTTDEEAEVALKQYCHPIVGDYAKVRYHIQRGHPLEAILNSTEDL